MKNINELILNHSLWLNQIDGKRMVFCSKTLKDIDFSNSNLTAVNFIGCTLIRVKFNNTNLMHSNFKDTKLIDVTFKKSNLYQATFDRSYLKTCDFSDSDITMSSFKNVKAKNISFENSNCSTSIFNYAKFIDCNLKNVNFIGSKFINAKLDNSNLYGSNFNRADLSDASLYGTNLGCVFFGETILTNIDMSRAIGLISQREFLKKNFKKTKEGYLVYKTFDEFGFDRESNSDEARSNSNSSWILEPGMYIEENPNPNRTDTCGCGINVAPLEWVLSSTNKQIWECLIEWEDLAGVIVPYDTDGKIRTERIKLLRIIEREDI